MKKEYDFSHAEQGKFYHPIQELDMPIYLEPEIKSFFMQRLDTQNQNTSLNQMINALLKKDIEISKQLNP